MPARQNEAVAVEPLRVPGIMFEKLGPESVGHGSGAHRHAGMTGVRVLDSVDRQYSDGVDAQLFQFSIRLQIHTCLLRNRGTM